MAEQLSTPKKAFDPFGSVFALPEGWEPPEDVSEFGDEPVELEEGKEEQSEDLNTLDNISEESDLLGDFVIEPADEFGPGERSEAVPKTDEGDEKLEGTTQFEDLKRKSKKKVGEIGEGIVEFGRNVGLTFKDQGIGLGRGLLDVGDHLNKLTRLNYLYAWSDEKLNEIGVGSEYSVVWNVEGSKGFDPDKSLVYMSKDSENPAHKRNYWTSGDFLLEEPDTLAGQIIRPVTSFLAMMAITRGFAGTGAPATWGGRAAEDALVGNLAFSPEGPRLYEYFTDMIEEIPVESDVGIKLATFLRNKDDDPMYLKQLRVAADSVFIEAGLTKLGGVLVLVAQTVKKMKAAVSKGAKDKLLEEIAHIGEEKVRKYTESQYKLTKEARLELKKLLERQSKAQAKSGKVERIAGDVPPTPSEKLLNDSIAFGETDLMKSLLAMAQGKLPKAQRILNIEAIDDIGYENIVSLLEDLYRRTGGFGRDTSRSGYIKKKALGQGIVGVDKDGNAVRVKRSKNEQSIEEEGLDVYEDLLGEDRVKEIMAIMDSGVPGRTEKAMMNDLDAITQQSARNFAYRIIMRDLSLDLGAKLNQVDYTSKEGMFILSRQFDILRRLNLLYSNIRGEGARIVTAERLHVLKAWTDPYGNFIELTGDAKIARDAFLNEQLNKRGMTPEFAETLKDIFNKTEDPLEALKWALKGSKSVVDGTYDVFVEAFRANLLSGLNVFQTAVVSGTIESFYAPLRDMLGSLGDAGLRTIRGKDADWSMLIRSKHRMVGLYKGYWTATKNALRALKNERNILDPLRSVVDRDKIAGSTLDGYAIQASKETMENNATRWLGHLINLSGKGVRLPIRVLGSIDEFLKQINYNSWVYAEMMEVMPPAIKNGTNRAKKDWVKGQHSKYFNKEGRATNKEGLDFARKQIFQEDLITSGIDRKMQAFVKSTYTEPFVPIIRTPSNIVKRVMERSFAPFQLLRSDVRQRWNSSPEVRAKLIGDTVIAGGMLTATWDLIGSGRVTGAGPRDPGRRELWIEAGFEPYSIRVGNEWYPYDRYAPFTAPLMMVANVYENSWEFNNRKDDVGLAMIMGFIQTLGDLHFIGNFFDLMDGMDEMYRTGEISTTLVDKGLLGQAVVPKYATQIAHGYAALKGQDEEGLAWSAFKNADTVMENISKDVAIIRGKDKEGKSIYDELGGDEWNWLTGEKKRINGHYLSGYVPVDAPETYDPVFQELLRMDLHLAAPQRYIPQLDITLTPDEMTMYQKLVGNIKPTINGKRRTLYEALELLMYSDRYDYDPNKPRPYPNNPGVRNWRVEKMQQILQKYKSAAFKKLLSMSPELLKLWKERKTEQHKKVRAANTPEILDSLLRKGFKGEETEERGTWGSVIEGGMGPKP